MFFLDKRIQVICNELKKLSVKQNVLLDNWQYKKGLYFRPEEADAALEPYENFSPDMHWYGPDKHYWFKNTFVVPESFDGKSLWIHIQTQIEEWDDAKNPQFLFFLNKEVIQGVDMNHRDILISKRAKAGDIYTIDMQAYTGILHVEFSLISKLKEIDEEIEGLYYDLQVPLAAFSRMDLESQSRLALERELNNTINILDLREVYSNNFYTSIAKAREYIKQNVYQNLANNDDIIASCIGHTHIDVAWWWTVAQTREKVARSFSTVLKLMDEYPHYKFMSSQPVLYHFLKQRYPEVFERIKEMVKQGRWEPEGGMWLEADCNLTSGESLVRQFLYGKKFFKDEFGLDNYILWLPDVFGYSGALPQIMKKSGIKYFMTTKLAWNQFNKIPHDTFMWRGIDGSEIFTHLITTLDVGQPESNFFTTYNGKLHPDALIGAWNRYQDKGINNDILISYGYGDGGGGPTREMLETSDRMEHGIKGLPKVRQCFAKQYFDELYEKVKDNNRLAKWEGELYFEYHRGTLTSMARNKRSNRKSEFLLMDLELIYAMLKDKINYPHEEFEEMWKTVLLNQFHDILPGTSIHEVYEVTKQEYANLADKGQALMSNALNHLFGNGDTLCVLNTKGFACDEMINIGNLNADSLCDNEGNCYPVQKTRYGNYAYLRNLPAKGYTSFTINKENIGDVVCPFKLINNNKLVTPYYEIELDEKANFSRIYDKENDREIIKEGKSANVLRMFEDKPIYYDNWDIDIFYTEKYWDADSFEKMEWTELGHEMAVLEIERKFSKSVIKQKIVFYASCKRIDFETYVDWKESQHLLKAIFPFDLHSDEAQFDIQFGNISRKTHKNTSWDVARFESCGQKWMDISEGNFGISLLNDCKYGHSVNDGEVGLSLIKSGIEPNPVTDQEEHFFTYSIYPHADSWRKAGTVKQAYILNQPSICHLGNNIENKYSLLNVNKDNVIIETIKKAEKEDALVVRMYESTNSLTKTKLNIAKDILKVVECNLMEEDIKDIDSDTNSFNFVIKPYEIKSFKIYIK